jgi:uncharacterized protein
LITFDTSGLYSLFIKSDVHHSRALAALRGTPGPRVLPVAILCEVTYLLERESGVRYVLALLSDIENGAFRLDCGEADLSRIRELVGRYADLPLGFADAAVIACAERNLGAVLTFDLRHFGVVAREGTIRIVP